MDDEFLTDEFFLKLIRLGVTLPENRLEIRKILDSLYKRRQDEPEGLPNKPWDERYLNKQT